MTMASIRTYVNGWYQNEFFSERHTLSEMQKIKEMHDETLHNLVMYKSH
jgi:hypothetical protein